MYMKHFSFKRKPFTPVPDHRELLQTRGHQELHARLQIALNDRLPSLIVGPSGAGKSTTTRAALTELDKRAYQVIEVADPRLKLRSFYRSVAIGLGLEPAYFFGELAEQVRVALATTAEKTEKGEKGVRHPIVYIDEAQLLTDEMLDSLRLLTNPLLGQSRPGLTLLLVGGTELTRRLKKSYFDAFVQRLRMTYRMPAIGEEEGRRYVAHRIRVAGGNPDLFEPAAVEAVLAEAGGSLRTIDDLCSQALYAAFIAKASAVTRDHVQTVVGERVLSA